MAYSHPRTVLGATGPTTPFGLWPGANGPSGPTQPPTKPIPDIRSVKPSIVQHRRLYNVDLVRLGTADPELIRSLYRNRLLVAIPKDAFTSSNLHEFDSQFEIWLNANVSGLYVIEETDQDGKLLFSFENEGDMMQFALVFR